jgi:hypothetical protein
VAGDFVDHGVELGAGERPLERFGEGAVVLAEVEQMLSELVEVAEAVRGHRLALHDREVDLDLIWAWLLQHEWKVPGNPEFAVR